ncbi:MAG: hypothetical protein J1F71_04200, partial [Clostridiales bacterium]|nr:hypothetical protein [Clostridiales bacterium]
MGRWGMGMSACDEFGDVKDEFLSQVYYTDNTFEQIEKNILADYAEAYADFDTDYGVWHDVYFAIADCEWQYGYKSERIWAKVEEIIVNGLDLKYMEELCASPQDIKQREKVLNKFWHKIQTQKEKPTKRKRKKPFENHFKTGDVFAYKHEGIYHCGVVLQVIDKNPECKELYAKDYNYCIAIAELTTQTLPSTADIINAEIRYAEWAFPYNLPPKCPLVIIDNIKDRVSNDYRGYLGYMLAVDRVA